MPRRDPGRSARQPIAQAALCSAAGRHWCLPPAALCHLGAHQGQQLAAVLDSVHQRVKATDQEVGYAQVVVFDQCVGHLLGRAYQRCGVEPTADLAQWPSTGVRPHGRAWRRPPACSAAGPHSRIAFRHTQAARVFQNAISLGPGLVLVLGLAQDGAERDADVHIPALQCGLSTHTAHDIARLGHLVNILVRL